MIPDYQTIMLPLLKLTSDNEIHKFREVVDSLAEQFRLTDDEINDTYLLHSGIVLLYKYS